jgi:hypothetical protein
MTKIARIALADLRQAHAMLELEVDSVRFRVIWIAAISLTRAIGHILEKIDSQTSVQMKDAVSSIYTEWKKQRVKNKIFFDFIKPERDLVLKEYEFGFLSEPVNLVDIKMGDLYMLDENLFCPISTKSFLGEDCRDVLAMSIYWWELQLDEIDRLATI